MDQIKGRLENESATLDLGRRLATATLADSCAGSGKTTVIHLHGELGAGKTTLTRGVLRGYGFKGPVKSPTYTLVEPYELAQRSIYHFDLYRLVDPGEVEFLGAEDYFTGGSLCIFEWAERGGGQIPAADLNIELRGAGAWRRFQCLARTAAGRAIVTKMRRRLPGIDIQDKGSAAEFDG